MTLNIHYISSVYEDLICVPTSIGGQEGEGGGVTGSYGGDIDRLDLDIVSGLFSCAFYERPLTRLGLREFK